MCDSLCCWLILAVIFPQAGDVLAIRRKPGLDVPGIWKRYSSLYPKKYVIHAPDQGRLNDNTKDLLCSRMRDLSACARRAELLHQIFWDWLRFKPSLGSRWSPRIGRQCIGTKRDSGKEDLDLDRPLVWLHGLLNHRFDPWFGTGVGFHFLRCSGGRSCPPRGNFQQFLVHASHPPRVEIASVAHA